MAHIVVIGKSGQLAQSLVEAAPASGHSVTCLGRPELDLENTDDMESLIESETADCVINAAAYTAVDKAESEEETANRVNAHGPAHVARVCNLLSVPFFHISTDYVFAGDKDTAYVETDPVAPTGAYGRSKLLGEQMVMDACPGAYIFRTAWVYSPFGQNFLKTMLRAGADRDELGIVGDQIGNPTYAPHIATGLLKVFGKVNKEGVGEPGLYHMAATGSASWYDFADYIFQQAEVYGYKSPGLKKLTTDQYPTPARRPANSQLECTKLAAIFDVRLPEWQRGTEICVRRILNARTKTESS